MSDANQGLNFSIAVGAGEPTAPVDLTATIEPRGLTGGMISAEIPQARAVDDEAGYHFRQPGEENAYQRAHWEVADTDRLNEAHWQFAQETPVNDSIRDRLPTLRARAIHESGNNPTIEGLKLQHTVAVHGRNGPMIDLQSESSAGDRWCSEAEDIFEAWASVADAAGRMTFSDMLKHFNFGCWDDGEFLFQRVNEDRRFRLPNLPHLRMKVIEPQRLTSPFGSTADQNVVLGIERNQHGRPLRYWIDEEFHQFQQRGQWIPADLMYHGYDCVQARAGQARGIPWSTWGLPVAADVRDYDFQVLDAARQAADNALFAYTDSPDAEFAGNVPSSLRFKRRRMNFLAPGWKPSQPTPGHPGAHYKEHRQEMHGDVGKAKGVPSMITRLDARDHNYSSARFDYSLLGESADHCRETMYTPLVKVVVYEVTFEAIGMRLIGPPPTPIYLELVWPAQPQIDQKKAAEAETIALRNGTRSLSDAISRSHGRRPQDVIRMRARDDRQLQAAGLPTVAESVNGGNSQQQQSSSSTEEASQPENAAEQNEQAGGD